jgi:hypothetical protein
MVLALLFCLAGVARAELRKVEVPLSSEAVTAHTAPDPSGSIFYVLTVEVPASLTAVEIKSALLDLYADVSSNAVDGWVNDSPVIELYALKNPYSEDLDLSKVHGQSAALKPVQVGEARRVVLDVTSIVQAWAKDPELNHGMILGSFRGMKEGVCSIRNDRLIPGELARITILYDTPNDGVVE